MRKIVLAAAGAAAIAFSAAHAADNPTITDDAAHQLEPSLELSKDGVYIAPGETKEVVVTGKCRRLTNVNKQIGYYFTPSQHIGWVERSAEASGVQLLTEAPCEQ